MNTKILSTALVLSSFSSGCDYTDPYPPGIATIYLCDDIGNIRKRLDDCLDQYCFSGLDHGVDDAGVLNCNSSFDSIANECQPIAQELLECKIPGDFAGLDQSNESNDAGLDSGVNIDAAMDSLDTNN